jgi:hypothetical protein
MKIPKTFPDLQALSYAREHARATGDQAALTHFERLHDRSSAWGGGYGTNIPLLAAVLAVAPPGPVLELGAGNFSTLLLAEMCRAMERRLVTFEAHEGWMARLADAAHTIKHVPEASWENASKRFHPDFSHANTPDNPINQNLRWAVALVDHAAGPGRTDAIEFLRDHADFIVVHDTKNSFFTGVDDALESFPYRFDYTTMCPTTTVVSMKWSYSGDYPLLPRRGGPRPGVVPEDRPTSDRPLSGPEDDEEVET